MPSFNVFRVITFPGNLWCKFQLHIIHGYWDFVGKEGRHSYPPRIATVLGPLFLDYWRINSDPWSLVLWLSFRRNALLKMHLRSGKCPCISAISTLQWLRSTFSDRYNISFVHNFNFCINIRKMTKKTGMENRKQLLIFNIPTWTFVGESLRITRVDGTGH